MLMILSLLNLPVQHRQFHSRKSDISPSLTPGRIASVTAVHGKALACGPPYQRPFSLPGVVRRVCDRTNDDRYRLESQRVVINSLFVSTSNLAS